MPHSEHLCSHEYVIDDEREGCSVCTSCGLVLEEKLYLPNYNETYFESCFQTSVQNETKQEIKELLHRINLPNTFSNQVAKKCLEKKNKQNLFRFFCTKL